MSGAIKVAAVQMAMGEDREDNLKRAGELVRQAAGQGAQVVLLPELFATPYFPRTRQDHRRLADRADESPELQRMSELAKHLSVVLPVSFFERDGDLFYNSLAMLDADGRRLGVYRKTHIPDGPGYEEKSHFAPGDTGFRVWQTRVGKLGVGICWDQWFPECARAMTLMGAELLLYPSAIGAEPEQPHVDTRAPWRRVMQGHAVANTIGLMASNRVGNEGGQCFYGTSFVCDQAGEILAELGDSEQGVALAEVNLTRASEQRRWYGLLRDRRPAMYGRLVEEEE